MSTPYNPPGSDEPNQWGQRPQAHQPTGGAPGSGPAHPGGPYPPPGYRPVPPPPPHGYAPYPPRVYPSGYPQDQVPPAMQPPPHPGYAGQGGYPRMPDSGDPAGPWATSAPGGDPGAGDGPVRRSVLPWVLAAAGSVGLLAVLILGFATPGYFTTAVFDHTAVQAGVQRILTEEYGRNAQQVSCPQGQEVQVGASFTCQAVIDGRQWDVPITVKSDDGEYEVGWPS